MTTTTADAWCDFGDLPADQCACPKCRPDVRVIVGDEADAVLPSQIVTRAPAKFSSRLACGHTSNAGDSIAKTTDGLWVCADCDPGTPFNEAGDR